jgi:hypothetical protein
MRVNIEVPEELYEQARLISAAKHIAVDDVFASALADHLAIWRKLQARAARGSREEFLKVLDLVPDVDPEEYD